MNKLEKEIRKSFLNSLFIEVGNKSIYKKSLLVKQYPEINELIFLKNIEHLLFIERNFILGIKRLSSTLQNEYIDHYYSLSKKEMSFNDWIHDLSECFSKNKESASLFLDRVTRSIRNIENDYIKSNCVLEDLHNFKINEKKLLFGHYAHPYPKLRETSLPIDIDLNEEAKISWLYIDNEHLTIEASQSFGDENALKELVELSRISGVPQKKGYTPFPIHPLQWETLKDTKLKDLLVNQKIIKTNFTIALSPTTSIRSMYNENINWMLKFSLSVRLTNSIRHLKPHEIRRGMLLNDVTNKIKIDEKIRNFEIMQEPFFCSIKNITNMPETNNLHDPGIIEETMVVFRANPFLKNKVDNKNITCSLALLNQHSIDYGQSLIRELLITKNTNITAWYKTEFLEKVIGNFLEIQCMYGILLGAHQQNIVLEMNDKNHITTCFYRDTQGSGFYDNHHNLSESKKRELTKNFITPEMGSILVGYYLFLNSTLGTIRSLALNTDDEQTLIKITTDYLFSKLQAYKEHNNHLLKYLLYSPYIRIKNNFRCCIENFNENAMENPLGLYNLIQNPFFIGEKTMCNDGEDIYTLTNNIRHPIRPKYNEKEILYTAHAKLINATIRLRVINRETDLDIFHEWHNQARVANFWELNKKKEDLLEYLSNALCDTHQMPVILEIAKADDQFVPVGYFEIYWTKEDRLGPYYSANDYDRGFHLLIGNPEFLGFDNTDTILKHVCHYIFQSNSNTQYIMGEPRHDNVKILKYLETFKAWEQLKVFDFPHKRAVLLRCDRNKFYEENYI